MSTESCATSSACVRSVQMRASSTTNPSALRYGGSSTNPSALRRERRGQQHRQAARLYCSSWSSATEPRRRRAAFTSKTTLIEQPTTLAALLLAAIYEQPTTFGLCTVLSFLLPPFAIIPRLLFSGTPIKPTYTVFFSTGTYVLFRQHAIQYVYMQLANWRIGTCFCRTRLKLDQLICRHSPTTREERE
jgi:hypothetical protein